MKKRYLVTGISGFWGIHLAPILVREGHEVTGSHRTRPVSFKGIKSLPCNFQDRESVRRLVLAANPDTVYHFAAQAYIPASWKDFEGTFKTNVFGTHYLLDILRQEGFKGRVLIFGSSSEYGSLKKGEDKISETHPYDPKSPYALSKVGQDLLGRMYHETHGMSVLRVIPFYVVGPHKEPDAPSDFAKAIALHKKNPGHLLKVGNVQVTRDLVDIRDAMDALRLIEQKGEPGASYNLCSGKGILLDEILRRMVKLSGSGIRIEIDTAKYRHGEDDRVVGDSSRLEALGWKPRIPLDDTLKSILDYWEQKSKGV